MSARRDGRVVPQKVTSMRFASERGAELDILAGCSVSADPTTLQPERLLMLAILEDAFHVWTGAVRSLEAQSASARARERAWIMSNDVTWPFSFVNVCHVLDLDVGRLRARLLSLEPKRGERIPQARRHVVRSLGDHIRERRPRIGGRPGRARQTVTATRGFGGTANP